MVVPWQGVAVSEWIPCSERLPANGTLVMVTILYTTDHGEAARCVRLDVLGPMGKWQSQWSEILAWRPLPEPWEG